MAATKRNLNWLSVIFTPTGGSATTYTGVTNVAIDPGGSLLPFSGDGDHYVTTIVNDFNDWSVVVTTADLTAALLNSAGTVGQLVAINSDAKNRLTPFAGQMTYTLSNAIVSNTPVGGAHRQYSQGTVTFASYSSDGVTSPMAIVTA